MVDSLLWLLELVPRVQVRCGTFLQVTLEPAQVGLNRRITINVYTAIGKDDIEARRIRVPPLDVPAPEPRLDEFRTWCGSSSISSWRLASLMTNASLRSGSDPSSRFDPLTNSPNGLPSSISRSEEAYQSGVFQRSIRPSSAVPVGSRGPQPARATRPSLPTHRGRFRCRP